MLCDLGQASAHLGVFFSCKVSGHLIGCSKVSGLRSKMITHYRVCPFAVCQVLPHPGTTFFLAMKLLVQLFPGLTDALSTNPLSQKEGRWGLIAATH